MFGTENILFTKGTQKHLTVLYDAEKLDLEQNDKVRRRWKAQPVSAGTQGRNERSHDVRRYNVPTANRHMDGRNGKRRRTKEEGGCRGSAFCHLPVAAGGARNPGSGRVTPWACVRQLPA